MIRTYRTRECFFPMILALMILSNRVLFDKSSGAIDKFAIMMNYRSYKMGCAAAYYNGSGIYSPRSFLIVCNYSFIDMPNLSIWEEGPAASKCKSGPDPKYSGLCLPPDQAPKKAKPTYPMPFNNPVQKHYCALEKKYCFNYQTNAYRSHIGCESDGVSVHGGRIDQPRST